MKNVTKLLLVLSVFAIGFSSCSKQKKIERHLYSKSGKWNNTIYDYKYYFNGNVQDAVTFVDAGYIEFEKDGKFTWLFNADGETGTTSGTWRTTDTQLTFVEPDNTTIYTILEESKNELKLEYTETDGTEREVYTLTFKKEK